MTDAQITLGKNGELVVSGVMNFETTPGLLKQSQSLFRTDHDIRIDFSQVENSNSAGLALIIEWIRLAHSNKFNFELINIPAQLREIARISGVEELLNHCKS